VVTRTIAYAPSDHGPSGDGTVAAGTVSVAPNKGGCGQQHKIRLNADSRPMIDCPQCGPALTGGHWGWANSPAGVPLTPDEQGEVEIAEREGQVAMRLAFKGMGETVSNMIRSGKGEPAPAPPVTERKLTAADLFGQMTRDERAEFARLLATDAAPAVKAELPVGENVIPPAQPPKRGPGRPPKNRVA
jgi:hypothetical protein